MSAKLISGGNIYLVHNSDQRRRQTIFTTSHLSSRRNVATPIRLRRMLSNKTSSRSFRSAGGCASVKAFYVPTQTTSETFYDVLGIPQSGTLSDIKKAYKQLARKYHPDVSPPERTEEYTKMFIMVHEAYVTLSDPQSRAVYDLDLARGLHLSSSSKRRSESGEVQSSDEEWKSRWQSQLNELKRRTVNKDPTEKASWASRMRRQR